MEPHNFRDVMKNLFIGGKYSDLVISCGGHDFRVHRNIVCSQSDFFEAAANGYFSEARANKITLPEDDPQTVERVLSYLYIRDYEETGHTMDLVIESAVQKTESVGDDPSANADELSQISVSSIAHNNIRVYVAADKFGIIRLKEVSKERFVNWANRYWNHEVFPAVVHEVLDSVPAHDTGLRDAVIKLISKNVETLLKREDMLCVMTDFGHLATGVLKAVVEEKVQRLVGLVQETSYGRLAKQLNELEACRHCGARFNIRVEGSSYYGWGSLRCGLCRTRH
ncbi:hypothetical protein M432DRAFT_554120 [Thermoascus aurantiacus ATCC 26904]